MRAVPTSCLMFRYRRRASVRYERLSSIKLTSAYSQHARSRTSRDGRMIFRIVPLNFARGPAAQRHATARHALDYSPFRRFRCLSRRGCFENFSPLAARCRRPAFISLYWRSRAPMATDTATVCVTVAKCRATACRLRLLCSASAPHHARLQLFAPVITIAILCCRLRAALLDY